MPRVQPLSLDIRLPRVELTLRRPEVRIHVRAAMEELGLQSLHTIARTYAARGRQAALLATARWAQEGDELRDWQRGVWIVDVTARRGQPEQKQLNVDVAPKNRPRVEVIPGSVEVELVEGRVRVLGPRGWGRGAMGSPGPAQAFRGPRGGGTGDREK